MHPWTLKDTFGGMPRLWLLAFGLVLFLPVSGQHCVLVVRADGRPAADLVATDPQGRLLGTTDAFGRLCLAAATDSVVIMGDGMVPVRMAWADALRTGRINLRAAPVELPPVPVHPWPELRAEQDAMAVTKLTPTDLADHEGASLRSALVEVPGVQMDQRGYGGSTRLSIRGSMLRSPYGVRGVKVYWGPFALTLADGSTPLELLDPLLVGNMEVVRSIGSPQYGSAPSGLLLAAPPLRPDTGLDATLAASGGPDGYFKLSASVRSRGPGGGAVSAGLLRLRNDGFRAQEYAQRDQAFLVQQLALPVGSLTLMVTGQKAKWGLPGSLDSLTAAQAPRTARSFSQRIDARVEKQQLLAGIALDQRAWRSLLLRSSVQVQALDKVNPYGTSPAFSGYKDETIRSAGARLSLGQEVRGGTLAFSWALGVEALMERDKLKERVFVDAEPDTLRTDADTRVSVVNGFLSTRLAIGKRVQLSAEAGSEAAAFHHDDLLRISSTHDRPATEIHPALGMEYAFRGGWDAHLRYAEAASRPTIWEVLGTAGIPNSALTAEHVREAELGIRYARHGLRLSLSGYLRGTSDMILPRSTADGSGEEYFNGGDARQNGVEAEVSRRWPLVPSGWLEARLSGAWQHHLLEVPDAQAVPVPGVPRWAGGAAFRWKARWGSVFEAGWRGNSDVPASSINKDRLPGYGLVHLRASHAWSYRGVVIEASVIAENLFNVPYTAFVQVNDPGGRYYNPASGRTIFMTVAFRPRTQGPKGITGEE
jgi:iron complex outermembrane receptor protein